MRIDLVKVFRTYFDEGDDGGVVEPPAPKTPGTVIEDGVEYLVVDGKKYLTQDTFNNALAKDRKKHKEQTENTIAELESMKQKANLTKEAKDELETRIQELQGQVRTKEEQAHYEKDKLQKAWQTEREELSGQRDTYKSRWESSTITRSITDASVKFDAYNSEPIKAMLANKTRLVEEKDEEGNSLGVYTPMVSYDDSKDGKPITLELSVEDAVKRMAETDSYAYLFKGRGSGGTGGNNASNGGTGKVDAAYLAANDPAKYRELREKGELNLE